jgi:Ribbon-helix-helix protein, copG family
MDDGDLKTISFKVSLEEAESIDTAARDNGLSRSDHIRKQLLGAPKSSTTKEEKAAGTRDTTVLLHQILFVVDRLYNSIFRMAETSKVLSSAQLDAIESVTARESIDFLSTIDERVARTRRQLAERRPAAPPAAEK